MGLRDLVCVLNTTNDLPPFEGLKCVQHAGYCVVLGKSHRQRLLRPTRKAMLRNAADRQRTLEKLMPFGTVLPVLPGMALTSTEAQSFISGNQPALDELSKTLRNMVQFQITVSWDEDQAVEHFGQAECYDLPAVRLQLAARFSEMLEEVSSDRIALPLGDGVILNTVVLLNNNHEAVLDQLVQKIDATWTEGLRIRQVGPSPALSFASIGVRRVRKSQVAAARAALDLPSVASVDDVAQARRRALKQATPEAWQLLKDAAQVATAVARSGANPPPPLVYVWQEGRAETLQWGQAA